MVTNKISHECNVSLLPIYKCQNWYCHGKIRILDSVRLCYLSLNLKLLFSQISHSLAISFQLVSAIAPTESELVNLFQTDADSQAVSWVASMYGGCQGRLEDRARQPDHPTTLDLFIRLCVLINLPDSLANCKVKYRCFSFSLSIPCSAWKNLYKKMEEKIFRINLAVVNSTTKKE